MAGPPMMKSSGTNTVLALGRSVLERHVEGEVTAAYLDALDVGGDQGTGDAKLLFLTQQVIRVAQLEGQAQHSRDRGQGDVTLVPGQAHAEHLFPFPFALADDAEVGNGAASEPASGLVRAKQGSPCRLPDGAGVVLLLVSAVVLQQLARP